MESIRVKFKIFQKEERVIDVQTDSLYFAERHATEHARNAWNAIGKNFEIIQIREE